MKREIKLISDFNFELFYNFLSNQIDDNSYKILKPSYELFSSSCYKIINSNSKTHAIIAWSRIEKILKEFSNLIEHKEFSHNKLNKELDDYIGLILKLSEKTEHLVVTSWHLPLMEKGYYLKDLTNNLGISRNLNIINTKLAEELSKKSNINFFNIDFLLRQNQSPFNPKLWYATKVPYNNKLFEIAANDFKQIIYSFTTPAKKLLILDLDNTLWGGIIGETGWKKINIGGHNYLGEAFQDFQIKIKALKNKGIQLAIISKNEEKVALEAFKKNKEMILKINDFVTWRINWEDKAKNLSEILEELNLNSDSCVFLDDNINERNRIRTSFPEVLVPELPSDPSYYTEELQKLNCFNINQVTKEDLLRTKYYKDELKRKKQKKRFISHNDWLKSLKIKVNVEKINNENKTRVLQLINKTNQMNLTTRRLSETELDKLIKDKKTELKAFRLSDKLGDMGLVGIYTVKYNKKVALVVDFILSCRAFGRSIENLMVYNICKEAKKNNSRKIIFKYLKTNKNKPCLDFLNSLNFNDKRNNIFCYKDKFKIIKPKHLN